MFRSERVPAFVVRHQDVAVGYLNRCAHVSMELDWQPGDFFEPDAEFLICATHGALYDPASGSVPRRRVPRHGGLRALSIAERDGSVY
jgi:nitrite reductase/ring-hydroxylating ferredoxin subunit